MRLGYNTNGLAHHDPVEAIHLLADIGYRSVALTIDQATLNPQRGDWRAQGKRIRQALRARGMRSVIETGARFLLDPRVKHFPTMMSASPRDRQRRVDFLRHAIEAAAMLESDCVSLWSGAADDDVDVEQGLERLAESLAHVLHAAAQYSLVVGFEPEPGMFIEQMSHFERLCRWIDAPQLRLTIDVGHLYCQGEVPIADYIHRWQDRLVNVHIEDMRAGCHEHLMFGDGEMRFEPIVAALAEARYAGGLHVELSRHSHEGPRAAARAFEFLEPIVRNASH